MNPRQLSLYQSGVQNRKELDTQNSLRIVNVLRSIHSKKEIEPITVESLKEEARKQQEESQEESVQKRKRRFHKLKKFVKSKKE